MCNGHSLLSQFLHFIAATVASLMVFSLYSIVDGLFVAHGVGEYAMAAVNLALPFTNVLFSLAVVFAVGTSTLIAFCLGQNNQDGANRLFSQNLAVLCVLGVLFSVLVLLFTEPFARLLGAQDVTLGYTVDYLRGLAPFAVCFMISYNLEILVKTDGYPKIAILTVITGCLTNCVLDYLAIFVFGLGAWGAAAATGASQLLTCVIYLHHFLRGKTTFRPVRFRMDWRIYGRLIPIGLPDGLTELCNGVMIFLFNRVILRCLGPDGLVSYTIIAYVNTLILNTVVGIAQGSQPLVSYHLGCGDRGGCRTLLRYGLTAIAILTALISAAVQLFAPQITRLFLGAEGSALAAASAGALRRYGLCYLLVGFNVFVGGFLTAMERPRGALCLSLGRGLLLQAAALALLAALAGGSAIWFAPVISEILCAAMAACFLRRARQELT